MSEEISWFTRFSVFETDYGEEIPQLVSKRRDPRFYDDSLNVFSKAVYPSFSSPSAVGLSFRINGWGDDRWPAGRVLRHRSIGGYGIHFVYGGKGVVNGESVGPGDGFVVAPGAYHTISSDASDPLRFYWVIVDACGKELFDSAGFLTYKDDGFGLFDFSFCRENIFRLCRKGMFLSGDGPFVVYGLYGLLFEIVSRCCANHSFDEVSLSPFVKRAMDFIRLNYSKDINVNSIAAELHLSRTHLRRLFLRDLGVTPKEQITRFRLEAATALMSAYPEMTSSQIAAAVGYPSYSQFVQAFRKFYGVTPRDFRSTPLSPEK